MTARREDRASSVLSPPAQGARTGGERLEAGAVRAPRPGISLGASGVRGDLALALILAALAGSVFAPALENGFTLWDDDLYVTDNPLLGDLSPRGVAQLFTSRVDANYLPLTLLSFSLERAIVGLDPWLYHLTNILLHALAGSLVYFLGRRWLASRPAALFAAALFAFHPLRAESVAWITERKDLLCAVFYLGALLAYDRAERVPERRWRVLSFALFLGALLSKVMAISFPAVLIAYHFARRELDVRRLVRLAPFLLFGLGFAVLGVATQAADDAVKGLHGGGLLAHLGTVVRAVGFYAQKWIAPVPLSPLYIFEPPTSVLDPLFLVGAAIVLAALAAAVVSWRRRRRVLFWLAFFALTWLPVSGLVPSGMPVADRYLYLPGLGVGWLVCESLARGLESRGWMLVLARAALLTLLAHLAVSIPLSARQAQVWKDNETLWRSALQENPENRVAYHQLAHSKLRAGRYEEALEYGRRAFELGYVHPRQGTAIACAFRGLGDFERERDAIRAVLAAQPEWAPAQLAFARHLIEDGRLDEAERIVNTPGAQNTAGLLLRGRLALARAEAIGVGQRRRDDEIHRAIEVLEAALHRFPMDAEAQVLLARAFQIAGRPDRALEHLERAITGASHPPYADVCRDAFALLATLEVEAARGERVREQGRVARQRGWCFP